LTTTSKQLSFQSVSEQLEWRRPFNIVW